MSEECSSQSCSSCGDTSCGECKEPNNKPLESTRIKKVIGVVSGKGGVGKSLVTSMMAVTMKNRGKKVGVLDADITGPSIPKVFGVSGTIGVDQRGIVPSQSKGGVKVMSVNLLMQDVTDPVLWRGPVIGNTVKQFWTDVVWEELDYLFIDMPPGTGDVPLTVFQVLPVDGILIVTSPQELVSMIVAKAVKMAGMMNIPIIGLVENMSYFHCPDNGIDYKIFGESHIEDIAKQYNLPVLAKLPINPDIAASCDRGEVENINTALFEPVADIVEQIKEKTE